MDYDHLVEAEWFGEDDAERQRLVAGASRAARLAATLDLKPLPSEVLELAQLLSSGEFSMAEAVGKLEGLPILAARVVHLANSAALAGRAPAVSVQQAFVRLGAQTVRDVVLAASVSEQFPDVGGAGEAIQRHSAQVALVARSLGRLRGGYQLPNLFLAALLHDVGKLQLMQSGEFT